jgi:glycerate kinase
MIDDGKTAVVDAAEAIGLSRLRSDELDPWNASSAGVGDLIAAAAAAGAEQVIVAPGGTASIDGGQGAVETLLAERSVPRLRIACDVQTAWESAALIFGPQKGADKDTVGALTRRLDELAARLPRDPRGHAMTGCGGGLSGGLWACFSAELAEGASLVLAATKFDELLRDAELVVTGEGQLDEQTGDGKLVAAVASRCRAAGIPCVAVVGRNTLSRFQQQQLGLTRTIQAGTAAEFRSAGSAIGRIYLGAKRRNRS